MLQKTESNKRGTHIIMKNKTGKTLAGLLIILMLTIMASACGTSEKPASTEQPTATDKPAASTVVEEQTKTIKHEYGETIIPTQPKRILSIGMEDILLTLDVPMVQAFSTEGYYLDKQIKEKGIAIDSSFDVNLEAIAAADTDLIIMNKYMTDDKGYEQLSKIAPTIAYIRDNWQSAIVEIGKALSKEDQANAALQAYQDKVTQAKMSIVKAVGDNKTVAFIRPSVKDVELDFPDWSWTSLLYNDLGLVPDPEVLDIQKKSKDTWGGTMISLEKLPDLKADYIFMDYGSSMASDVDYQKDVAQSTEVEKLNVWKAIPAVKQGNVFLVSARNWALSGPIADGMKIDDVVKALTSK